MAQHVTRRTKRMKDLPYTSRPREKLLIQGEDSLSDAELVAVLLNTGTRTHNAVSLAEQLLRHYPLKQLADLPTSELLKQKGIGKTKASRIHAALALGERLFAPASVSRPIIRSTTDALTQCADIASKKQEHLLVLYLNARHELIHREIIGRGNLNTLLIEPKEIFTPAMQLPCNAIILVHNHPSGDVTPSDDDIRFTTTMQKAGEIMGIQLIDHLIVAPTGYFSFRDSPSE